MKICIALAGMFLIPLAAARAASPLPQAFSCGKPGVAGGLAEGTDLVRHVLDLERYPEAVCNDGTPGVFYYGPASKEEDRDKWIIFLQGGGSCIDGQSCAERWCSVDSNYGLDKMSTSLSKAQIRGAGFLNPDPRNRFGSWNRVLVYYCSSDAWSGTAVRTTQAALNGGAPREYQIYFEGARIVDAVLDTLRNEGTASRRRAVRRGEGGGKAGVTAATAWPDLDAASAVIFAGSSAGGAGVRANLDHVAAKLRATNPGLDVRGVIDAIYGTLSEDRDFTGTTYCAADPVRGCSYEPYQQATWEEIDLGFHGSRGDESCLEWHTLHAPGTEWRCGDGEHVNLSHITTPFFIRQDLLDTNIGGSFVEAGFGSAAEYATRVQSQLGNLPAAEEPRGAEPGLFVPQCTDHESFTSNERVFEVKVDGVSFYDAVWNWWSGLAPQKVIRQFTGTVAPAPECP